MTAGPTVVPAHWLHRGSRRQTAGWWQAGITVEVIDGQRHAPGAAADFLTLSRRPVITDLWDTDWQPGHTLLPSVRPAAGGTATANALAARARPGRRRHVTHALSHSGRVLVAPAMNPRMWAHPAVQANCRTLRRRGVRFVGPVSGRVACGEGGVGRLAAVDDILKAVLDELAPDTAP